MPRGRRAGRRPLGAATPCPAGAEPADVLWVPHATPGALAAGRLHGFLHALREGGTVVLHGDPAASCLRVATLRGMLLAEGLCPITQVVKADGFYLSARKPRRQRARLAA